jgi:hypothetical protein
MSNHIGKPSGWKVNIFAFIVPNAEQKIRLFQAQEEVGHLSINTEPEHFIQYGH